MKILVFGKYLAFINKLLSKRVKKCVIFLKKIMNSFNLVTNILDLLVTSTQYTIYKRYNIVSFTEGYDLNFTQCI